MKNFAIFSKVLNFFRNLIKNKKKSTFLMVVCVCLVVCYFVFAGSFNLKSKEENSKISEIKTTDYATSVETKLESMLSKIEEINSISVMVLVESTPKIEYLTESEETQTTNEKGSSLTTSTTVVFEKDGSVSTPVVITTIMPKVSGVLIVVNQISPSTKISIINSISVVLNIEESCISILQES